LLVRLVPALFVAGLAASLSPNPAQAQSGRTLYTPTCNANIQVGDITSSQVSQDCRQQDLGSYVIRACMDSFIADVDGIGQAGADLASTIEQLQRLKREERLGRGVEIVNRRIEMVKKAGKLVDSIRKGSGVLQNYAASCLSNGLLTSLGLQESYATLESAKKASDSVDKVANALIGRIQRGDYQLESGERNALGFVKSAYGAGQALKALEQKTVKLVDGMQPAEGASRAALVSATTMAASCEIQQADGHLRVAGEQAATALAQARLKRAQAWSVRSCWANIATNYFKSLANGGVYLRGAASGRPLWQTMPRNSVTVDGAFEGCTSCRSWSDADQAVQRAQAEEKRLEGYLASVNKSCSALERQAETYNTLEERIARWKELGELALYKGSCNLANAHQAVQQLADLEGKMAAHACAPNYEAGNATTLVEQIREREHDSDCNPPAAPRPAQPTPPPPPPKAPAAAAPAPTAGWPIGQWLNTLCQVQYLPYTAKNGKAVQPAHPIQTHLGAFIDWDAKRKFYFVRWGEGLLVSASPSFSFHQCDGDLRANPRSGCLSKGRDSFHVLSGQFTISASTVTGTDTWLDDAAPAEVRKGTTTCVYHK
jgi:hypothetical protein